MIFTLLNLALQTTELLVVDRLDTNPDRVNLDLYCTQQTTELPELLYSRH